jgi:MtrB/PioB family decaheme-associated outer membrane protein
MKPEPHTTTGIRLLGLALMSLQSVSAAGAEPPTVDTSNWKCRYCPFEEGFSGEVEAGAGHVSGDSFKFGEDNGLEEEGGFFIGNATARYRAEDATYLDLLFYDLGLDSRSLSVEGGRQGKYKLFLEYDEIPHYISDSAATPYRGTGSETLSLPAGWVDAGSTAGMSALAGSLRDVDLHTKRERLGVGVAFVPRSNWQTAVQYRHEEKEGKMATAGSFFFNAAQLVEPVDYVTDQVDASVSYSASNWQAKLAYYGSMFNNKDQSLLWQNAYTPLVAGADEGQLALPPDNQFHQIVLSGAYQLSQRTQASADLAVGRMEQDEDFLPATVNSSLAVAPLPRGSADAEVDTLTANFRVVSAVTDKLRLNGAFTYNDRDNDTPQSTYDWVTTDSFVAAPRTNQPYSFTQSELTLSGDYRIDNSTKVSAGFDHDRHERTRQEVNTTRENTVWGKISKRARENVDLSVKFAHAERNNSPYKTAPDVDPPQNPLLRKYNLADRTRNSAEFHASVIPHERVNLGFAVDFARDDYSRSQLGLTDAQELGLNADASVLLTDQISLHLFVGRERIRSKQAGSQSGSVADWFARNDDTVTSAGIGVAHQLIEDKLDVGADYVSIRSTGKIDVDSGTPDPPFPDLKTDLDSLKLYANYRLREDMTLHAAYWYENYNSKDWHLDGVAPDTISNVLSFGADSPDYEIHVITLSLRYKF